MSSVPGIPDLLTFGLEEEFFLVDPTTRHAVPRVPQRLVRACRSRLGDRVTYELKQAQVEIVSPVFSDGVQALREMRALRRGVADVAQAMGFALIAAGTHPMSAWQRLHATQKPRYRRFIDTFQMIGRRDLMCGLHVHVAVPAGVDRVQLMNRLLPWLPLFLALSTSSPFWNRQRTGLLSYRSVAYDEWPRTGIPDFFADEAEYARFVALLARAGALVDASELWWAIRPSLNFPTLELRIADACTRAADAVALAVLFRALVRAHLRRPDLGIAHGNLTRRLIDENRWRAKRYGLEAEFIDEQREHAVPVRTVLDELRALVAPDLGPGDAEALQPLDTILALGTSAHAQLAVHDAQLAAGASPREALRAVVDWLIAETLVDPDHVSTSLPATAPLPAG